MVNMVEQYGQLFVGGLKGDIMAYGTYEVKFTRPGSSSTNTTTENGNSESEVRQKMAKRVPGLKIISIKKK